MQEQSEFLKKIIRTYSVFFIITLFSGCAYFNMYFNAKESYNEAERKRKETNVIDKNLYENSLKELSKILEFYPESRWVDDSILMMGLCYLRQSDYYKAQRKFNELLLKFPDSELIDRARIHLAEVEIALKNYEEAGRLLESIGKGRIDIEPFRLYKLNADMSLSKGDSAKAFDYMLKASESAESESDKMNLLQAAAEIAEQTDDYQTAAGIYMKLSELQTEREKIFNAKVKQAEALMKSGDKGKAISILEDITSDQKYASYSLKGEIKLAKFYLENDMEIKTYDKLDEILRVNPKDRNNGPDLSEAAFYFGEYYFRLKKDFRSAEVMYDSSGYYDRRNEFYKNSADRKNLIVDFRNLRRKIEEYPQKRDSIDAKINRLKTKLEEPELPGKAAENADNEISVLTGQRNDLEASYIINKSTLADKALFHLNLTDTAMVLFEELSKEKKYPHKASKALMSLIITDSLKYKTLEDTLLEKYPETAGANFIRSLRGIEPVLVIEDSAGHFFNISSGKFLDSLYHEAAEEYLQIARKYNKSPLSPKILQAAALIAENYLRDYPKAAEIYSEIKDIYPQSVYARFASQKLRQEGGGPVGKETAAKTKILSDADRWYMMDRRND